MDESLNVESLNMESLPEVDAGHLWDLWLTRKTRETRTRLFLLYSKWCRVLATHLFLSRRYPLTEWRDYTHFASVGLLQAIDQFDPRRNIRFEDFAGHRIRGEVLNGVSRYASENANLQRERERLNTLASEKAEDDSLAVIVDAAVGLAFGYFLELGILDQEVAEPDPLHLYSRERAFEQLSGFVEQLSENEQMVIICHYFQQLDFVEIATLLEVSKARVSQLHLAALRRLRTLYENCVDMEFSW